MFLRHKSSLYKLWIIILIFTYIYLNTFLNPYKNCFFVIAADSLNSTNSIIKSHLISVRSYSGTSEKLITDAISLITTDPSISKNRLYYAKYYYTLCSNKVNDLETVINSIPNISNNKTMLNLLSSLQEKQTILNTLCDNIDELMLAIDRHQQPSQSLLDNIKYKSTFVIAFLNNILENYDSSFAPSLIS
jgi:putative membrane protein